MELVLVTVGEAARILDRSSDAVRGYADNGRLKSLRTQHGQRLFALSDVRQLAKELPRRSNQSSIPSKTPRPSATSNAAD